MGVSFTTTVTPWPAAAWLGVTDGLGDGIVLPDALGVGSTVGPDDEVAGDGRPSGGVTPTSTTRGEGAPPAPTAPELGDDADGPGTIGDDETTGGDAAGTWPPLDSANALYARNAAPRPATA